MQEKMMPSDGSAIWAGMGNFILNSPDKSVRAELFYVGEPPHGDSYHSVIINSKQFPGWAWGCLFAFSQDSRYLVFSWMATTFERKTVVVDCKKERYFMLPNYIYDFQIDWPNILPKKENAEGYLFLGDEKWIEY